MEYRKFAQLSYEINACNNILLSSTSTSNISSFVAVLSGARNLLSNKYHEALQKKIREPDVGATLFFGCVN